MAIEMKLKVDSEAATPGSPAYVLRDWPPPDDFPVVIDASGKVISRFGDSIWNLSPYCKKRSVINFGDGEKCPGARIDAGNARLMRIATAWWMYGDRPVQAGATIVNFGSTMRVFFAYCSNAGILASDLLRYPRVIAGLAQQIAPSAAEVFFHYMHEMYEAREGIGFTILDRGGLRTLESLLPDHQRRQTPYIPPRIWTYQVERLRTFLDDYIANRSNIEACFKYCLDAYEANFGTLANACSRDRSEYGAPFRRSSDQCRSFTYYGPFYKVAEQFDIAALLTRWCLPPGTPLGPEHWIRTLSNYLTQVSFVGTAYLLNFSGMRIEEACLLRADALKSEVDDQLGTMYMLRGETSKTARDDDALWITSPSVSLAIEAMSSVSRLRIMVAAEIPEAPTSASDIQNPRLRVRAFEPWTNAVNRDDSLDLRLEMSAYDAWEKTCPNLFDQQQLKLTEDDLHIARLITPTLDPERFCVGKPWSFTWHQLRRTTAVNMTGSGIVSDASLQYQLKHLTRAMSLYYGQGYSQRNFNKRVRSDYIRTIYEMLGHQFNELLGNRYVSPLGEGHKDARLKLIGSYDHEVLKDKAKKGLISYRENLFGVCLKAGSCPYGGIDNVIHCGGGPGEAPCPDLLIDRHKRSRIETLAKVIAERLEQATPDSPDCESLLAQQHSVERNLNAIEETR